MTGRRAPTPSSRPERIMDDRRKRILYRAKLRGMKETDLILGGFAETHVAGMSDTELDQFETLLEEPDTYIMDWLFDRAPVPAEHDTPIMARLKNYRLMPPV
ncbi:succinate dehydrogenase assembly factor 2 [uncultured Rhodospira sp.]|uniref:FAD assembly factor SdhE n=1 Tax=uncultured Rhodospira sp. TaxID=1936189 RepID=UPI002626A9FE|nr:succinate dehydrogenase assembly factor 2 [uncultured Rhodospira sp.]